MVIPSDKTKKLDKFIYARTPDVGNIYFKDISNLINNEWLDDSVIDSFMHSTKNDNVHIMNCNYASMVLFQKGYKRKFKVNST